MNEYISKGNAIFAVSALPLTLDAETTQRAIEAVRTVPAADVKPVVRGKWINTYIQGVHHYRCTNCGEYIEAIWTANFDYNFCPNCGADMREVQG